MRNRAPTSMLGRRSIAGRSRRWRCTSSDGRQLDCSRRRGCLYGRWVHAALHVASRIQISQGLKGRCFHKPWRKIWRTPSNGIRSDRSFHDSAQQARHAPPTGTAYHVGGQLVQRRPACARAHTTGHRRNTKRRHITRGSAEAKLSHTAWKPPVACPRWPLHCPVPRSG